MLMCCRITNSQRLRELCTYPFSPCAMKGIHTPVRQDPHPQKKNANQPTNPAAHIHKNVRVVFYNKSYASVNKP